MTLRTPKPFAAALSVLGLAALLPSQGRTVVPESAARILRSSCAVAGCHGGRSPAMDLNLEPAKLPEAALDKPSSAKPELRIIDSADPRRSYLLAKIAGDPEIAGQPMPLGQDPLSPAERGLLEAWIMSFDGQAPGLEPPARASTKRGTFVPAFWGTTVANLPTTTPLDKGRILFRVSHRFFPSATGGGAFLGFGGPAFILIGLGYGLSDRLFLDVGRTNSPKEASLGLHWAAVDQGRSPFSLALHAGSALESGTPRRLKFNVQIALGRRFNDRLSLAVVPSLATRADPSAEDPKGVIALGLAGRIRIIEETSLIGEWTPVLSGYEAASPGWALGLEKKIGGHVFQVFILNSTGLMANRYLPGGDLRLADGDFRIGFNIYRLF
ncbi:MAG: hypothetical protein FJY82_14220 [Candidatus Aminicenantes bacterium]|nr:hypothetical protein [Candidatus Aminicenantes bacterium]